MSFAPITQSSSSGAAAWPPRWNTMPHGISVGRYIDPDEARKDPNDRRWMN